MRTLQITCQVTEEHAGPIIADLAGKTTNFSINVVEEVPHTRNKPRAAPKLKVGKRVKKAKVTKGRKRKPAHAAITELLATSPGLPSAAIVKALTKKGYSRQGVYTALSVMKKAKTLAVDAQRQYSISKRL